MSSIPVLSTVFRQAPGYNCKHLHEAKIINPESRLTNSEDFLLIVLSMRNNSFYLLRFSGAILLLLGFTVSGFGQSDLPVELSKGTIKEQMIYLQEKTRIYENYRAIREDMFQQIKRNCLDSVKSASLGISNLQKSVASGNLVIDSLRNLLDLKGRQLEKMSVTKNSISLFGIEVNKGTYNAIILLIIAVLAGTLIAGFLSYKRTRVITLHTRKDYEDLKKEFEAYRKASREARERMSMAHFNELKKLRTG